MDDNQFVEQAPRLSLRNRTAVESAEKVSCYFCLGVRTPKEIVIWTDEDVTAICPGCGMDSIVPGEIERGVLEMALVKWFGMGHKGGEL